IIAAAVAERVQPANRGQGIGAGTAIFRRHGKSLDAERSAFFPRVPGELFIQIALNHAIIEFLLGEADYFISKGALFLTPSEVQERLSPLIPNGLFRSCRRGLLTSARLPARQLDAGRHSDNGGVV